VKFEDYLISKKIDSSAFQAAEPEVWNEWKAEFEQQSPVSFTAQKLYLINPIRRKYLLKQEVAAVPKEAEPKGSTLPMTENATSEASSVKPAMPKPMVAKPVFKPKPKLS
jgi:hypothetical protein